MLPLWIASSLLLMASAASGSNPVYTMKTLEATPRYIKGQKGDFVKCSTGDTDALTINKLPGLTGSDRRKSFAATKYKGFYIKGHLIKQYLRLKRFQRGNNFARLASFKEHQDKFINGSGAFSYESFDHPGFFLMCSFGKLIFFQPRSPSQYQRASFLFVGDTATATTTTTTATTTTTTAATITEVPMEVPNHHVPETAAAVPTTTKDTTATTKHVVDTEPVYIIRTDEARPQYVVAEMGQKVLCSQNRTSASTFHIVPGMVRSAIAKSFESTQYEEYYLKGDSYFSQFVRLNHYQNGGRFKRLGSFRERVNRFSTGTKSYESVDHRRYYLMCSLGKLVFYQPSVLSQRKRASFIFEEVSQNDD